MTALDLTHGAVGGSATTRARDPVIDAMRGIAILMVIGIHSLPRADDSALVIAIDAALRPCVPAFLFASGYLTARAGDVPLTKRVARSLGPYTVAFVAAYLFMAVQNPLMDHRPALILARYGLAYIFVYYYVFVYISCTVLLWLAVKIAGRDRQRLIALLNLAIVAGLTIGAYLDPLLQRLGLPPALIEEARMRDLPFWFGFMAAGAIVGSLGIERLLREQRWLLLAIAVIAYAAYASVRIFKLGDAADYDSIAFFLYALLFCLAGLALAPRSPMLAFLGAASYAIYLWHIFAILVLRALLAPLQQPVAASLIEYAGGLAFALLIVLAARSIRMPRLAQWLGT